MLALLLNMALSADIKDWTCDVPIIVVDGSKWCHEHGHWRPTFKLPPLPGPVITRDTLPEELKRLGIVVPSPLPQT